jgi:lysozyme family protein
MAQWTYDAALARLLAHEGGYTNDAADPGGPTNFGITIYDYRKYVKPGATAADVRAMKIEEAKAIYRNKYWDAQRCDELPAGVDYAVFDYGVNSGIGRSGKVLRRVLGLADNDWHTDDAVLAALGQRDAKQVVVAICDERLRFLQSLRTWPVFGKGWGARVAEVKAYALKFASGAAAPAAASVATSVGKGAVPTSKGAQQGSAGAVLAAGAAAAQQAHQSGASSGAIALIAGATILVAVAVYALWHWRQARQQIKPA